MFFKTINPADFFEITNETTLSGKSHIQLTKYSHPATDIDFDKPRTPYYKYGFSNCFDAISFRILAFCSAP